MMSPSVIFTAILLLMSAAYYAGRKRAFAVAGSRAGLAQMHSRPTYYGLLTAMWCGIPALLVFSAWSVFESGIITHLVVAGLPDAIRDLPADRLNLVVNDIRNLVSGNIVSADIDQTMRSAADHYVELQAISHAALGVVILTMAMAAIAILMRIIAPGLRARNQVENIIKWILIACSTIAIFTTVGILLSVLFEAIRFFEKISITEFLFGLKWSPQMAIRADQVGSSGAFGAVPVFAGTLMISAIAMVVAVPIGLLSAIYLSEYANRRFRAIAKPLMEILAGIPTVVYGFFAALTVAPLIRDTGLGLGLDVSSESALAAGLVMGIMIIPFVSSLSDDVINAVPQAMRDGAYGFGRHQVRDRQTGRSAGGPARHRGGCPAGRLPGHRGDHDRGHGGRIGGQPDRQPAENRHHRHRPDRHAPGGRSGIRQPQDPGRLCPGSDPVYRDTDP
jgi:phosphate transport system permease protein